MTNSQKGRNIVRSFSKKRESTRSRLILFLSVLAVLGLVLLLFLKSPVGGYIYLSYHQMISKTQDEETFHPLPRARSSPATGPLRINPTNSRYFTDSSGKAVLLVGSDYWNLWQDGGRTNPPPHFDYDEFIQFALDHGYNYLKSHTWEQSRHITDGQYWYIQPTIWARTGPGNALDGDPKFDLNTLNPDYFDRVRSRVSIAEQNGLYVIVNFFHGFSVADKGNISDAWTAHPMNAANNINGINGDPTNQGNGLDVDTLNTPAITAYQEAYIRHMVDTLNDLDNVIWEVALEPDGTYVRDGHSTQEWVQYMIDYIHSYEAIKPKQHPVLYSVEWPGGDNRILMDSTAEAISPNDGDGYITGNPPPSDGTKVILANTDHILWPHGDTDWAWKMFTRGMGGIFFMDQSYSNYDDQDGEEGGTYSENDNFRNNLGWILDFANQMNLASMNPRGDLCSTDFCLANPVANGAEYLIFLPSGATSTVILEGLGMQSQDHKRMSSVYLPSDSSVTVDLSATPGNLLVEWLNPATGEVISGGTITGGKSSYFIAPFPGSAVLYLYQSD